MYISLYEDRNINRNNTNTHKKPIEQDVWANISRIFQTLASSSRGYSITYKFQIKKRKCTDRMWCAGRDVTVHNGWRYLFASQRAQRNGFCNTNWARYYYFVYPIFSEAEIIIEVRGWSLLLKTAIMPLILSRSFQFLKALFLNVFQHSYPKHPMKSQLYSFAMLTCNIYICFLNLYNWKYH